MKKLLAFLPALTAVAFALVAYRSNIFLMLANDLGRADIFHRMTEAGSTP